MVRRSSCVRSDEEERSTTVIVPDYQLSLAIGKRGQNARLAAKLTGWKIDIKSETDARELGIYPVDGEMFEESENNGLADLLEDISPVDEVEEPIDLYADEEHNE